MAGSTMPNLTAMLGLLALAGYRNRDRISVMLSKAQESLADGGSADSDSSKQLNDRFTGNASGRTVSGALGDLIDRFKQAGQRQTADSWISAGPNRAVGVNALEEVIGHETLAHLAAKTGLSNQEILTRLSNDLPNVVNDFTPLGRIPTEQEARGYR